jgi:hypothetical protein
MSFIIIIIIIILLLSLQKHRARRPSSSSSSSKISSSKREGFFQKPTLKTQKTLKKRNDERCRCRSYFASLSEVMVVVVVVLFFFKEMNARARGCVLFLCGPNFFSPS